VGSYPLEAVRKPLDFANLRQESRFPNGGFAPLRHGVQNPDAVPAASMTKSRGRHRIMAGQNHKPEFQSSGHQIMILSRHDSVARLLRIGGRGWRIRLVFPGCRAYVDYAMSLAEIEAELDHLGPEELRRVALKSWSKFVEKERRTEGVNECDEDDPRLLAALDEAIAKANATPSLGYSGRDVRARLNEWTTG